MRILFIGGTGNISTSCARLCVERGMDVVLLNRGRRPTEIAGARSWSADVADQTQINALVRNERFDAVADFIAFTPADVERDLALFAGRTRQFFFISSASAYQKPLLQPVVTESTPLKNPFWEYSRNKIACEDLLTRAYRERDFPAVIVRPSHTYATIWPIAVGPGDDFTIIERVRRGDALIVHGDGTTLWTVTHCDDFAKGFVGLIGNDAAVGHAFQITSDERLTWNQIVSTICVAAGVEPKLVHIPTDFLVAQDESFRGSLVGDKIHSPIFDNSKIKCFVPDFSATIPFHVGIRRTLAWFEADPARRRVSPAADKALDALIAGWGRAKARW
jgi:nucleoside-diphosphate-sugar epimerase